MTGQKAYSLGREALAYIPVKIIPGVAGLLSILILTRNLAPEEYGRYSIVVTTALLFVQLAGTWLSNSILFLYPAYAEKNVNAFNRHAINLQLLIALPAMGIVYLAILLIVGLEQLALVGAFLFFSQTIQAILFTIFQASRKILSQTAVVTVQTGVQITTLSLMLYFVGEKEFAGLVGLLFGFISGVFVACLILRPFTFSTIDLPTFPDLHRQMLRYGLPMCLWFFATQFYTLGDRFFLGFYGFEKELGKYASFRDLATGCSGFLTMPMLMASHPMIMAAWKNGGGRENVRKILSDGVRFLTILFIPLIAMTKCVGEELLIAMFGERYSIPSGTMTIVVATIFIGAVTMYVQRGLEVTGRTGLMAGLAVVAAIFCFLANMFVVPVYGVFGGALVTIISQTLYLGLIFFSVRKIVLPSIKICFVAKLTIWFVLVIFYFDGHSFVKVSSTLEFKLLGIVFAIIVLLVGDAPFRALCAGAIKNAFIKIK